MKKLIIVIMALFTIVISMFSTSINKVHASEILLDPGFTDIAEINDTFGQFAGFQATNILGEGTFVIKIKDIVEFKPDFYNFTSNPFGIGATYLDYENSYDETAKTMWFLHRQRSSDTTLTIDLTDHYGVSTITPGTTLADLLDLIEIFEITQENTPVTSQYYLLNNGYIPTLKYSLDSAISSYVDWDDFLSTSAYRTATPTNPFNDYLIIDEQYFYNLDQTSGPTSLENLQAGSVLTFSPSWLSFNSDYNSSYEFTAIILDSSVMQFNLKTGDQIFRQASTSETYTINIDPVLDADLNPTTDFKLAPIGDYAGMPSEVTQTYTFLSFNASDAAYKTVPGQYTGILKFTGDSDSQTYTFNVDIITEFRNDLIIKADKTQIVNEEEVTTVYNNGALLDLGAYYNTEVTELAGINSSLSSYFEFSIEAYPTISPSTTFKVLNSKNEEFSNEEGLLWFQVPDKYKIVYTSTYLDSTCSINIAIEVKENLVPSILGPSAYNHPIDEEFNLSDFLSSFSVSDDIDTETVVLEVLSTEFNFDASLDTYEEGDYIVQLKAIDQDGLENIKDITLKIYTPLIPNNTFKIIMSTTSSIIGVLLIVFIANYIIKKTKKARRRS